MTDAGGDVTAVDVHREAVDALARRVRRTVPRRERQLVEILLLAVDGDVERAAGLAAEHALEFPDDADAVAVLGRWSGRRTQPPQPGAPARPVGGPQ